MSERYYLIERHGVITKFVAQQPVQLSETELRKHFKIPDDCDNVVQYLNEHQSWELTNFFDQFSDLDVEEDPKGKAYVEWDSEATIVEDDGEMWRYCFSPFRLED